MTTVSPFGLNKNAKIFEFLDLVEWYFIDYELKTA
jgi:hypothetical protein